MKRIIIYIYDNPNTASASVSLFEVMLHVDLERFDVVMYELFKPGRDVPADVSEAIRARLDQSSSTRWNSCKW